uniref:LOB domain-containing protein n=1 Tax=Oryza glumipatula TaxID=40148 RepID=A0A0D9YFK0_9ORYZ
MRNSATPGAVGELAELVLPWLPPQDLAAAASASRALRAAASSVSAGRAADAAHGLEPHPIPFDNLVDGKPYAYFLYTPFSLTPSSASASPRRAQPWGRTWARPPGPTWPRSDLGGFPSSGCACAQGACGGARGCPCADPEAEAVGLGSEAGMGSLRECGDGCACGPLCGNRRTQLGVTVRLRVVRHREKGWGLHAAEVLRRRQFVCEYAGELLTTEEARRRQGLYDELASVEISSKEKSSPSVMVMLDLGRMACRAFALGMHSPLQESGGDEDESFDKEDSWREWRTQQKNNLVPLQSFIQSTLPFPLSLAFVSSVQQPQLMPMPPLPMPHPPGSSKRRGAVERPASGAGLQAEEASSAGPGAPCGACKFLRRRCVPGCVFAPHFSGCGGSGVGAGVGGRGRERGAAEFAAVHRVFGASNVAKLLSRVPAALRRDAARTVCYEAQARIADPVYGSVGTILALQHQVSLLQGQLSVLESQLFNLRVALASAHPDTPPQHFVVLQPAHSAASTPNQVVVNYDDLPHAVDFMDAEPAALRGLESLQLSQPLQREEDEGHRDMNLFSDSVGQRQLGFGSHTIKVLEVLIDEISWAQSKSSAGDQRKALLRREG